MLGTAGQDASLQTFLDDQFCATMDIDETEIMEDQFSQKQHMEKYEGTLTNRVNFWNYIAVFLGTFVSSTFASSLEWDETFKVSLKIVVVAYLVFCSGKCCYDHENPAGKMVAERMNQAKPLVKLPPLWITFIVYSLVEATGYTLFIEQSENLDDRIDLWIPIYSLNRISLTSFYSSEESIQHRARFVRFGIGMCFAIGCCIAAWRVEVYRLSSIRKFESKVGRRISEDDTIPMTILWLAPQFFLLRVVKGILGKGLKHLFYDRVPVWMWFLEYPFNEGVLGFGRFVSVFSLLFARPLIGNTINESLADKYLLIIIERIPHEHGNGCWLHGINNCILGALSLRDKFQVSWFPYPPRSFFTNPNFLPFHLGPPSASSTATSAIPSCFMAHFLRHYFHPISP
ncbi:Uncharacterized protein TCM_046304 [Theobroma cacao]|uniref:Uncharacterized protein n=1 Tax=Theobroma cacao TaxID=3641 RepID=S1SMM8_THECC|nr:Uncharacterized protein TCM_046304 [Theobroma cacao]